MEPPLPPLNDDSPFPCSRCGALIIGKLPICPGCGEQLALGAVPEVAYQRAPTREFGCLTSVATLALAGMALLLLLVALCFVSLALGAWAVQDTIAIPFTLAAIVCSGLLALYLAGIARFFRKL